MMKNENLKTKKDGKFITVQVDTILIKEMRQKFGEGCTYAYMIRKILEENKNYETANKKTSK